ncbi:type II toxin-antitoxin system VapC family toxin [Candidatus Bathyarchaeota archaeon]|nr:type II toxin-antitoxin system VapC family toxin [Candidatus Bathyarchaeota archaeon]
MSIVFDTEPLLTFYKGEPGDTKVQGLLERTREGTVRAYMNIVNLTELYYILHRVSPDVAEEKTRNLKAYGVRIVPVTNDGLWRQAAVLKSLHPMSLADAYAVATAQTTGSTLVVGRDPELEGLDIETIRI